MTDDVAYASSFSRCAVKLTLLFNETALGVATGVVANHGSGPVLITAGHNFTGRSPATGKPLSGHGGFPNRVRVQGCAADFYEELFSGENSPIDHPPRFATHSNAALDVAVLRSTKFGRFSHLLDVSFLTPSLNQELPLYVSQTCHIIGFPVGLTHEPAKNVLFPIWKTGHIATEPNSDIGEGDPRLLIDATTRRGMSGSMVIVRNGGRNRLVGIYTGRYKPATQGAIEESLPDEKSDQFTAELGWVTKSNALIRVIPAAFAL